MSELYVIKTPDLEQCLHVRTFRSLSEFVCSANEKLNNLKVYRQTLLVSSIAFTDFDVDLTN